MDNARNIRFIRRQEVERRIGKGRSTIYASLQRSNKRFDPSFPRPVRIGSGSVAWVESEIEDWIKLRIAERVASPA